MKRIKILTTLIFGLFVMSTSCSKSDDDSPQITPEANRIEILSGANQTGIIETELASPIVVLIKDQNGNSFAGATVNFSATQGTISTVSATSDGNGLASTNWTLGAMSGAHDLTATAFKADGVTPLNGSPLVITAMATEIPCQSLINPTVLPVGPDAAAITTSIINVSESFTVTDMNVTLNINHTWVDDLDIFLIAPDGTTMVELTTDNGGSGDNFVNTVFDDDATLLIVNTTSANAPFTNVYQPEGSLADFNGLQSNGNWTLSITDDAGGDGGELINWSLEICGN